MKPPSKVPQITNLKKFDFTNLHGHGPPCSRNTFITQFINGTQWAIAAKLKIHCEPQDDRNCENTYPHIVLKYGDKLINEHFSNPLDPQLTKQSEPNLLSNCNA